MFYQCIIIVIPRTIPNSSRRSDELCATQRDHDGEKSVGGFCNTKATALAGGPNPQAGLSTYGAPTDRENSNFRIPTADARQISLSTPKRPAATNIFVAHVSAPFSPFNFADPDHPIDPLRPLRATPDCFGAKHCNPLSRPCGRGGFVTSSDRSWPAG